MKVRTFEPQDHHIVSAWWKHYDWPAIPMGMLSNNGFIAEHDGQGLCAGWLYQTDSGICWLEFIVANPAAPKGIRSDGLNRLIDNMIELASHMGFEMIFTSVEHLGLMDRLQNRGFKISDTKMTNLTFNLGGKKWQSEQQQHS